MIRKLATVFAFWQSLLWPPPAAQKLQARDNLNKGVRAFKESKYENAVEYFEEAIKLDPDSDQR